MRPRKIIPHWIKTIHAWPRADTKPSFFTPSCKRMGLKWKELGREETLVDVTTYLFEAMIFFFQLSLHIGRRAYFIRKLVDPLLHLHLQRKRGWIYHRQHHWLDFTMTPHTSCAFARHLKRKFFSRFPRQHNFAFTLNRVPLLVSAWVDVRGFVYQTADS